MLVYVRWHILHKIRNIYLDLLADVIIINNLAFFIPSLTVIPEILLCSFFFHPSKCLLSFSLLINQNLKFCFDFGRRFVAHNGLEQFKVHNALKMALNSFWITKLCLTSLPNTIGSAQRCGVNTNLKSDRVGFNLVVWIYNQKTQRKANISLLQYGSAPVRSFFRRLMNFIFNCRR